MSVTINEPNQTTTTVVAGQRPVIEHVTQAGGTAHVGSIKEERVIISNTLVHSPAVGGDLDALHEHVHNDTPHPAYDVDMPSLRILFENGLV